VECPATGLGKRVDTIENKMEWFADLKTKVTVLQWTGWALLFAAVLWFFTTCILPVVQKIMQHQIS
jgi:hypothetical protein